jgi:squalene-hopene/tetraprenyl-beta-curcumene cyclase
VYGTARVLSGLNSDLVRGIAAAALSRRRAVAWLLDVQNRDGGWGGNRSVCSSIEETGVVLAALSRSVADGAEHHTAEAIARGSHWLMSALEDDRAAASPVGLYFARLWYYEDLYPLVFGLEGLAAARELAFARP